MSFLTDFIDNLSQTLRRWLVKRKKQIVVIRGSCNMCGKCCRGICLYIDGRWLHKEKHFLKAKAEDPLLERFEISGRVADGALKFHCRCLNSNGSCDDYENRPQLCRNFPSQAIYYQDGQLPEGCGFRMSTEIDFEKILDQALAEEAAFKTDTGSD